MKESPQDCLSLVSLEYSVCVQELKSIRSLDSFADHPAGLVVKVSALGAEDLGFESGL